MNAAITVVWWNINPSPGPATGRIYARSYPMKTGMFTWATSGCLLNTHFVMQASWVTTASKFGAVARTRSRRT